jgi:hypothetical protein
MLLFLLLAAAPAADQRRIPFWPDVVPAAIHAAVDGGAALQTVRELGAFHRVHGSPGFAAAAEHLRRKAVEAGLSEVTVEHLPADGHTQYAHFRSYFGWAPDEGVAEETSPRPQMLARFPDLPVALADYSQDTDVTAQLVDVGAGVAEADYAGKEVKGRIALASGEVARVHKAAVEARGALGFLSDYPNQTTAWSGEDRDLVRWGHLSPYQTHNTFAFMLSKRQSQELRRRLAAGEKIVVHAKVKARMVPATYDVVSATIPGTDPAAGEVVLTAHLCHESAGANDNASGSAAIFEAARALRSAMARGALPAPRRTIRFLWLPEIAGSQAWLISHPDLAKRLVAGVHMDMVGGRPDAIHGTLHLSRAAESKPHVVSVIAAAWLDEVIRASERYAEHGGDAAAGFAWPSGMRDALAADVREVEMGSDHDVFQESSFGVPMAYFHDWPDTTIHTNKDQPDNLDATKLGRVAYMGAGIAWTLAALPDAEAPRLLALASADAEERLARARLRAALSADARDAVIERREALAEGAATLRSIGAAWPAVAPAARRAAERLEASAPRRPAPGPDRRIPVRDPGIRGPLSVYYYDHFEAQGLDAEKASKLLARESGGVLAWEALNLVDGRRTVSDIRDVLTGRYATVSASDVSQYFDLLARAKVLTWK